MTSKPPFDGEVVRLGELISRAEVERCGDRQLPVLSMTMHDGIVHQRDRFKKAVVSKDTSSYKVVYPRQLVVGFPIDEGVIYVQNFDEPGIMSPAYNVWNVDNSKINPVYLELALHSPQTMTYYTVQMKGTTARRRTLSTDKLCDIKIPLPPMDRQVEIAALFQRIKGLLRDNDEWASNLDALVKSRFVEMFGMPAEQHEGWAFDRLDAFCDVVTGNTPSRKRPEYYGDYVEWIKTDNITEAAYLTEASERLSELGTEVGRVVPAGSVLMACIAGSVKSIGKVAVANRPVAFNQQINALIPHVDTVETAYLLWMLRLSKGYLCSDINMQLKGILNKSNLSKKVFSVPPLALQREFANFASRVDKLRFVEMLRDSVSKFDRLG